MLTTTHLDEVVESIREARRLTFDLLEALTPAQLGAKLPRPDLDTFGKHFQELGDTQESYALAVTSGVMDFGTIPTRFDYELIGSRRRLREFLEERDRRLFRALEGKQGDEAIRWEGGEEVSLAEHLSRMVRHEVFHHGQFAVFAYHLGVGFPRSWAETWVLPAKGGELYEN